jgi:hypothetical protein
MCRKAAPSRWSPASKEEWLGKVKLEQSCIFLFWREREEKGLHIAIASENWVSSDRVMPCQSLCNTIALLNHIVESCFS